MDGDDDDDNDDDDDGECGIIGIPRCGAVTLSQTVRANIRQLENLSFNIRLIFQLFLCHFKRMCI